MVWGRLPALVMLPALVLLYLGVYHRFQWSLGLLLRAALVAVLTWSATDPFIRRYPPIPHTVIMILDVSASLDPHEWRQLTNQARKLMRQARHRGAQVLLIQMGTHARRISQLPLQRPKHQQTDLVGALNLALALAQRQTGSVTIWLLTDGSGQPYPAAAVRQARALKVSIRTWHPPARTRELVLTGLYPVGELRAGVPIRLRLTYRANFSGVGTLTLTAHGRPYLQRQLAIQKTEQGQWWIQGPALPAGPCPFWARVRGDQRAANNRAFAMPLIQSRPTILLISNTSQNALARALQVQGFQVDTRTVRACQDPAVWPPDLRAVVVTAPWQSLRQSLAAYAARGGGLLFIQHLPSSSPPYLPVRRPVRKPNKPAPARPPQPAPPAPLQPGPPPKTPRPPLAKLTAPVRYRSVAVVFLIDRSGSMDGAKLQLAKIATLASLRMLWPEDWVGIIAFDRQAQWIVPLRQPRDHQWIDQLVNRIDAGWETDMYPALQKAARALARVKTHIKHIILLSDGISDSRYRIPGLVHQIARQGITVSTIGIGEDFDVIMMSQIARWGGGKFNFARKFNEIPQVMIHEVQRILGLGHRTPPAAQPVPPSPTPPLRITARRAADTSPAALPPLPLKSPTRPSSGPFPVLKVSSGPLLAPFKHWPCVNSCTPLRVKPGAQISLVISQQAKQVPLLVHWQWRASRIMVFNAAAQDWEAWSRYPQFWSRMLRFLVNGPLDGPLAVRLNIERHGSQAVVQLWVRTSSGDVPQNLRLISQPLLQPCQPGLWQGRLNLPVVGQIYPVQIKLQRRGRTLCQIASGCAQPYEQELADLRVRQRMLQRMEAQTAQQVRVLLSQSYHLNVWLLAAAIVLLICEILLRFSQRSPSS